MVWYGIHNRYIDQCNRIKNPGSHEPQQTHLARGSRLLFGGGNSAPGREVSVSSSETPTSLQAFNWVNNKGAGLVDMVLFFSPRESWIHLINLLMQDFLTTHIISLHFFFKTRWRLSTWEVLSPQPLKLDGHYFDSSTGLSVDLDRLTWN